jgi:hypothetical protein
MSRASVGVHLTGLDTVPMENPPRGEAQRVSENIEPVISRLATDHRV